MTVKRKELTTKHKQIVITLTNDGISERKNAETLEIQKSEGF
jgi:hypothetical protein